METIANPIESSRMTDIQTTKPTILFIDNDIASYFLVMELLSEHGINVIHSRCGKEAISIFKTIPSINIVITELILPNVGGFGVLNEIRKINPVIPVIAQTAHVVNNMKHSCLNAGFNDFIDKPIDLKLFTLNVLKHIP
jgi:CheY-like chemotaxis protein